MESLLNQLTLKFFCFLPKVENFHRFADPIARTQTERRMTGSLVKTARNDGNFCLNSKIICCSILLLPPQYQREKKSFVERLFHPYFLFLHGYQALSCKENYYENNKTLQKLSLCRCFLSRKSIFLQVE